MRFRKRITLLRFGECHGSRGIFIIQNKTNRTHIRFSIYISSLFHDLGYLEIAATAADRAESNMQGGRSKNLSVHGENDFLCWSTRGAASPQQTAASRVGCDALGVF